MLIYVVQFIFSLKSCIYTFFLGWVVPCNVWTLRQRMRSTNHQTTGQQSGGVGRLALAMCITYVMLPGVMQLTDKCLEVHRTIGNSDRNKYWMCLLVPLKNQPWIQNHLPNTHHDALPGRTDRSGGTTNAPPNTGGHCRSNACVYIARHYGLLRVRCS